VALEDVAATFRGVAGGKLLRNAKPCLYLVEFAGLDPRHRKARALQVIHPAGAAVAVRIAMNRDAGAFVGARAHRQ
jgi:hypothetical protein